jgi:two-component system nitrogen regulation sensor histidine kinase NtrY
LIKQLIKFRIIHLFLAIGILFYCFNRNQNVSNEKVLLDSKSVFDKSFENIKIETNEIYDYLKNVNHWYKKPYRDDTIKKLFAYNNTVLKFENDTLSFWNNNSTNYTAQQLSFEGEYALQKLKTGYYIFRKLVVGNCKYYFIIPLKLEYTTGNDYLQSGFSSSFKINNAVNVSLTILPNAEEINLNNTAKPFYIYYDNTSSNNHIIIINYLLFIISLILLVEFCLSIIISQLSKHSFLLVEILFLIILLGINFIFNTQIAIPHNFFDWGLFNPNYYASPFIANSLGILVIKSILIFFISVKYYFIDDSIIDSHSKFRHYFLILRLIILVSFGIALTIAIKSLIIDSNIAFEFFNPYNPDYYNLISVSSICVLCISFYFYMHKSIIALDSKNKSIVKVAFSILGCTVLFIYYILGVDLFSVLFILFIIIAFLSIYYFIPINLGLNAGISSIFILLIFFSASFSFFLNHFNTDKELSLRSVYAKKLINERDNVTEYLLGEIRNPVLNDKIVQDFFIDSTSKISKVIDQLNKNYFNDGFNRFDVKYFFYDDDGHPIPTEQEEILIRNDELINNSEVCGEHELYFITEPAGSFTYVAEYPIKRNNIQEGTLMVQLTSKVYKAVNVYPELLLEEKNKLPLSNYSFSIYSDNIITEHSGNYTFSNYNIYAADSLADNDFITLEKNNYNHLIYKRDKHKVVVVSLPNDKLSEYLSFFSYLFMLFLVFVLLIVIVMNINILSRHNIDYNFLSNSSFRTFIQFSFFIIILSSVLIIGVFTGQFFIQQFNRNAEERLTEKLEMVDESTAFLLKDKLNNIRSNDDASTYNLLRENITSLSSIQDIDINFYNSYGDLITSSQPAIYEKGLISKKINPEAYYLLGSESLSHLIQKENIAALGFLSGYKPLFRKDGSLIAILHLPFFNSTKDLSQQIGIFFASLVSILVFALIIAGLLAPFISRNIIRRLSIIADKFKQVTLGKKNEPIEWHTKDEIGSLVEEFNKMILKLDKNAELLAKSERESAWREMAKQVAHEIKNPLTPMKLSIQHLQRAYQNDAPNRDELAKKVSNTLIEQIDNLTKIANEFSTFAKMPESQLENISLHQVLKSSVDLYKENENAVINYHSNIEGAHVLVDKNQLLRVFNNLILNAIQSIPENRRGVVNIKTSLRDRFIQINIIDNGKGINKEEAQKVFVPNFTTKSSGTGLGLAISKNIIEGFGGEINFSSEVEEGTTFTVLLPRVKN